MSELKDKATEVVKAVGEEAQADGAIVMAWVKAHPAIMAGFIVGTVIGFFFGYLIGSHWG